MKHEELKIARMLLRSRPLSVSAFIEALNAIFTLSDDVPSFRALAEAAYEDLQPNSRGKARFWMLSLFSSCGDHAATLRLAPKRFGGEFAVLEFLYTMEAVFAVGDRKLMKVLARRLPRFIQQADHPITRAELLLCLARSRARELN